ALLCAFVFAMFCFLLSVVCFIGSAGWAEVGLLFLPRPDWAFFLGACRGVSATGIWGAPPASPASSPLAARTSCSMSSSSPWGRSASRELVRFWASCKMASWGSSSTPSALTSLMLPQPPHDLLHQAAQQSLVHGAGGKGRAAAPQLLQLLHAPCHPLDVDEV